MLVNFLLEPLSDYALTQDNSNRFLEQTKMRTVHPLNYEIGVADGKLKLLSFRLNNLASIITQRELCFKV